MTIDDVHERITNKTKAIILNSPSNPTGSVMKKEDIKAISEIADDNGIYLISDEVYEKIIYDTMFTIVLLNFVKMLLQLMDFQNLMQ